jgi:predicted transcriptional regulator of viral defense system
MARISREQVMQNNKDSIINYFKNKKKKTFTLEDLKIALEILIEQKVILKTSKLGDFASFLDSEKILTYVEIKLPKRTTYRYVYGKPFSFEIALGLRKNSYLSHYSALFLHNLTNNVPKNIYTNVEQAPKHSYYDEFDDEPDALQQKNIDLAFSRPMRVTNQIAHMELNNLKTDIYLLNGKGHERIGVIEMDFEGISYPVTSIERTLIDIVVRPNYAGGIQEVLYAFSEAKNRVSINKLLATLKKMDFTYPYYQLVGFYLEKSGYSESVLKLFKQFEIKYNLYLTYQMKDKELSERWRVFYPKGF